MIELKNAEKFVISYSNLAFFLDCYFIQRENDDKMTYRFLLFWKNKFVNACCFDSKITDVDDLIFDLRNKINNANTVYDAWSVLSNSNIRVNNSQLEIPIGTEVYYIPYDGFKEDIHNVTLFFHTDEPHVFSIAVHYLTSLKSGYSNFYQFYDHPNRFSILYAYNEEEKNIRTCCLKDKPEIRFQKAVFFGVKDGAITPCPYKRDALKWLIKDC